MDAMTCLAHVRTAVAGTAAAATGNLDTTVEHCPEFDVAKLLEHTGGFGRFVGHLISSGDDWEPSGRWRRHSAEDIGPDPIEWHLRCGAELIAAMEHGDPSHVALTWAGQRPLQFWYRRAAQELTVHWWDAERARGHELAIEPAIAVDGIDEYLFEFSPRFGQQFRGSGETLAFVSRDVDAAFAITLDGDSVVAHGDVAAADVAADVTACGTAANLLLYLWGRVPPTALAVTGRAELLDQWQDRVRI